jgi:F-type H+-transporting ATPase subunit b
MPQLDQFTYLTQFIWLCIFYMTFYVLLFNDGLPKISRILKLRAYLCNDQHTDREQENGQHNQSPKVTGEKNTLDSESQDVIFRTLNSSVSYLNSSVAGALRWCTNSVEGLNSNQLKSLNKSYLRSIGELGVSQLIKYNALEASAPNQRKSSSMFLEIYQVWALGVQRSLINSINKKKKRK